MIKKDSTKESGVASQQKENEEKLKQIGSFKVKEEIWEGFVMEYLLEKLSQSHIDGRNGSNACTVISSIMVGIGSGACCWTAWRSTTFIFYQQHPGGKLT